MAKLRFSCASLTKNLCDGSTFNSAFQIFIEGSWTSFDELDLLVTIRLNSIFSKYKPTPHEFLSYGGSASYTLIKHFNIILRISVPFGIWIANHWKFMLWEAQIWILHLLLFYYPTYEWVLKLLELSWILSCNQIIELTTSIKISTIMIRIGPWQIKTPVKVRRKCEIIKRAKPS